MTHIDLPFLSAIYGTGAFMPPWRPPDRLNLSSIPRWPERRSYIRQRRLARAARRARRASR